MRRDADPGNEQAANEDWDASEGDERVANEAPVAQTLPVIKIHQRISLLTTEAQQMLIGAKVPFYQRGGELVRPIIRTVKAAHGHLTKNGAIETHQFGLHARHHVPSCALGAI